MKAWPSSNTTFFTGECCAGLSQWQQAVTLCTVKCETLVLNAAAD